MATRKIKTGHGDFYCKNGSDLETTWKDYVDKDGKDKVVCCELDKDYQHNITRACFRLSGIVGVDTPSGKPDEPQPERPHHSGDVIVNVAAR